MDPVNVTSNDVRSQIISSLKSDLVGPIGVDSDGKPDEKEILMMEDGIPQNFYITGYLEPKQWTSQEELIDSLSESFKPSNDEYTEEESSQITENRIDDSNGIDDEISSGNTIQAPSSMGISVVFDEKASEIHVETSWGEYVEDPEKKAWIRSQYSFEKVFSSAEIGNIVLNGSAKFETDTPGVYLYLRAQDINSNRHLTCRLVNEKLPQGEGLKPIGAATIFQCKLRVSSNGFGDARWDSDIDTDPTTAILYHDSKVYSRGHNVSVDWNHEGTSVWTEWIPQFEVRKMTERKELSNLIPDMHDLINPSSFEKGIAQLSQFTEEYSSWNARVLNWYESHGEKILTVRLKNHFQTHLKNISETIERMKSGIKLLQNSPLAAESFQRANESILCSSASPAGNIPNFKWRPFQISFILMNLPGVLWDEKDSIASERGIVDLAWFPTGGGKTEAYLGLIATLGFYRYNKSVDSLPSVHCIMRYTLRLLTLNQGERATRLMVGMNLVGRKYGISDNPFSVGMWIGSTATPNKLRDAVRILNEMKETGGPPAKGATPIQLEDCPWCSQPISNPANWNVIEDRLVGFCPNSECELHTTRVPFSCIDEELYNHPPTLLIGTIDKFARLGSEPKARTLIGLKGIDEHRRPPDLVIQDELHLLTGPLGSLSGLFESAIETLWERANHKAKYVAATATIRGAARDSKLMYGRELNIFPPPGSSISDNFFATEQTEMNGRKHLAIIGNLGHSTTLMERPFASVLQRIKDIESKGVDKKIIDPYWTPIGYFNSIRELSGAQSSLEDAISQQHMPEYARRSDTDVREIESVDELFSRKKAHDLKETLNRLRRNNEDSDCLDVCLTTNMFQVGIDVDRLGLMLINGQPKSNSEYIQASGRVGRTKDRPGLVISLLRSAKPRDLSHYEMHRSFHQEMYRHVDITTTTPFSPRAFDRAVASVLMLLLRQGIPKLSENDQVRELAYPAVKRQAELIIDSFLERVLERVNKEEEKIMIKQKVRGQWQRLKDWSQRNSSEGVWRSKDPYKPAWAKQMNAGREDAEDILDSMRDVSEDIPYGIKTNTRTQILGKIPESHLFSHALPGGLWDKDGQALMTRGLNNWEMTYQQREQLEIKEDVLKTLLGGVRVFRPPRHSSQGFVTTGNMPYNVRCAADPAHISDGKRTKEGTFCSHPGCEKPAVPVRFVSLCSSGHLAPFSWNSWVRHSDNCSAKSQNSNTNIRLKKLPGAGYTLAAWIVSCTACGQSRSLKGVTVTNKERGTKCNELRPWINWETGPNCDHKMSNRRRNSSSVALPDGGKVLLIHPNVNWYLAGRIPALMNLSDDKLDSRFDIYFEDCCDDGTLDGTIYDNRISDPNADPAFDKELFYTDLVNYRNRPDTARRENIRELERRGLSHGRRNKVDDGKHYLCYTEFGGEVPADGWWQEEMCPLDHLSRVERLTEVQYINGVRRLDMKEAQPLAEFSMEEGDWNLGTYNYGEGIYIGVSVKWLMAQTQNSNTPIMNTEDVSRRSIAKELDLENVHVQRHLPVLHTFSHLIIKELCSESGYSLGSIGERLYLSATSDGIQKAGILLYTTGSSSDGTLGGLASQGNRRHIEKIVKLALRRKNECSNDPICSDHRPTPEEPNGSACHACVLLPETSCELGNKLLDRNWEL